jgi:hypothetical protein
MYCADEVRDFNQVPKGDKVKVCEKELELGIDLIERLTSEEFHPENYQDEYRIRVLAMLDEKSKGKETVVDTAAAQARPGGRHHGGVKAQHGTNLSQNRNRQPPRRQRRKRTFPKFHRPPHGVQLSVALKRRRTVSKVRRLKTFLSPDSRILLINHQWHVRCCPQSNERTTLRSL